MLLLSVLYVQAKPDDLATNAVLSLFSVSGLPCTQISPSPSPPSNGKNGWSDTELNNDWGFK